MSGEMTRPLSCSWDDLLITGLGILSFFMVFPPGQFFVLTILGTGKADVIHRRPEKKRRKGNAVPFAFPLGYLLLTSRLLVPIWVRTGSSNLFFLIRKAGPMSSGVSRKSGTTAS